LIDKGFGCEIAKNEFVLEIQSLEGKKVKERVLGSSPINTYKKSSWYRVHSPREAKTVKFDGAAGVLPNGYHMETDCSD
jgi:hypothetical protein